VSGDTQPSVVWLFQADDDKTNQACDAKIFQNEPVGLALRKFRCFRLDVNAIADDRIRKEYEKAAPGFLFFDPSGDEVAKVGKRKVSSLSGFNTALERTWRSTFTVNMKTFTKKMGRILDQIDRLDTQKQIIAQSKARLAQKPKPRKMRSIEKEEEQLKVAEKKVLDDERLLADSVELRAQYLPEKDKVAKSD
jgi:hypothetical protein